MIIARPNGAVLAADVMTGRQVLRLLYRWRRSLACGLAHAGEAQAAFWVLRLRHQ